MDAAQFAKDVQAILAQAVTCPVYEGEAPREDGGGIAVTPPYVEYSCVPSSPDDEGGVYRAVLSIGVWALNGWGDAFAVAQALDDALDGGRYDMPSGLFLTDQAGAVFQRVPKDPTDARIRRMTGQYMVRFYPDVTRS